jgi:NAD(P)-dependent dehydrogenase (short-subunit alcohol dehydrogenase family)
MAVVLVTGASSGIGLATARRLAEVGDEVFGASRRPCPLDGVTSLPCDLTVADDAAATVARVLDAAGRIDAVVSVAGSGTLGAIEDVTDAEVTSIFETNVFGPLRLARAALPTMRAQGRGRIVHVTSMNDVLPAPFAGHYSASKAALASASAVLDAEVRPFGVAVTVVAPGLFRTPMAEAMPTYELDPTSPYADALRNLTAQSAARIEDAGDPDDVARAIVDCVHGDDPPARVVVGEDAQRYLALLQSVDAEQLASLLREMVSSLRG